MKMTCAGGSSSVFRKALKAAVDRAGAEKCLALAKEKGIDLAILQSRSPSCGVLQIYDGTFSGKLIEGSGVFAAMLRDNGFKVLDAEAL